MFYVSMPLAFSIGETVPVRINREPATLTWRDADHLVINGDDVRVILKTAEDTLRHFYCADAGHSAAHYTVTVPPGAGGGFVVSTRPDPEAGRAS